MAERYRPLNGKYLADAERLLAAGDYPQASEKFWGAVANFYEDFAPPDIVAAWAEAARRLVEKLRGIAPPEDAGHGNTA